MCTFFLSSLFVTHDCYRGLYGRFSYIVYLQRRLSPRVGRGIELEKQSTCHSVHSSTLRQVQDENLRGRGVRVRLQAAHGQGQPGGVRGAP